MNTKKFRIFTFLLVLIFLVQGIPVTAQAAGDGELTGSLTESAYTGVNLTSVGDVDWAVWGYASSGTSTSLSPDVGKSGGTAISALTNIVVDGAVLRGLGQFRINHSFSWTDGTSPSSATYIRCGLQHNVNETYTAGDGFSFTVPADTQKRRLIVYAATHYAESELTATLSDGSAGPLALQQYSRASGNEPSRFIIDYAAESDGGTLTVSFVTTWNDTDGNGNAQIYAVALSDYHTATINVSRDGTAVAASGSVELRQGGITVATAAATGETGIYAALVLNGTYDIYINSADTGKDITINSADGSADIDYCTVSYAAANEGTASGSTISATYDGDSISSGTVVLSGKKLVITAAGAGANTYAYAWTGDGTSGETTAALTINSLSAKVDATCTVTGTTLTPPSVGLTNAAWTDDAYTCGIELSSSAKMVTISVGSGYFTVPSLGESVLTYLGGTNGSNYISEFGASTQYDSAVFSFTDVSSAETLLGGTLYYPDGAASQTITATAGSVSPLPGDLYFEGHYYRYVSGSIDWPSAVIAAGAIADPYFGGRGYIATATSQAENSILLKLTDTGGSSPDHWYDAWMGGLWQRNTGTVESPSITRGTDGYEITYSQLHGADDAQRQNMLVAYRTVFPDFDGDDSGTFICNNPDTVKYYWIDGPEAGQEIENNVTDGFSPWHSGEPNGGDFVYIGWQGAYWDDLSNLDGNSVNGYIVEFSGFDCDSPADVVASDTKTVPAVFTVTYDLNGGTNPDGASSSYTCGTGAALPTPTKTGYTFDGWYTGSDFSGSAVEAVGETDSGNKTYYAKWTEIVYPVIIPPARTIIVAETSSGLFEDSPGAVMAGANMDSAFSNSVEVKVTDTDQEGASFGLGAGTDVYPFDISLYIKGTSTKTEPASGYAVTISLPVPEDLLDVREQLSVVHKSDDGTVTTLSSGLKQIGGVWYLVFEATEFSPYALAVSNAAVYDETAGLPYYPDGGGKVFIGFAAAGKYIAPEGMTVLFTPNPKDFSDTSTHWGKANIGFVTEREIFVGTGVNTFSPDTGMTRAMFATVIGRLYERSYGEIEALNDHAFTDCDYGDYYGKYVDWASENGIIESYGNGGFGPDDPVTREQAAAILYRFAKFLSVLPENMDTALTYTDEDSISSWAESAALYCQSTGIITGRGGGSFAPQGTATRAEAAAILERFIENVLG